jgi:hypothetical protein
MAALASHIAELEREAARLSRRLRNTRTAVRTIEEGLRTLGAIVARRIAALDGEGAD